MRWIWLFTALFAVGCHSAGPYGYSRVYSPLDEEEDALEGAAPLDPVMVERERGDFKNKKLSFFGVVKSRKEAPGGKAYLTLGMRTLSPRNLCDEMDEETCRVTVSDREHAVVHVVAKLQGADDIGKLSVQFGSLLRVVGRLADDVDKDDGGLVLQALYTRHWPRDYYVTTEAREHMRL